MYAYTVELNFFWYNVVCFPRVEYEKNQMRVRYANINRLYECSVYGLNASEYRRLSVGVWIRL